MYGKQFIDLKDGRILPVVLMGSNNCTEYIGGREVLERNWGLLGDNTFSYADFEKLMSPAKENEHDYEMFKENGKWICRSNYLKWLRNAFNSAMTIEEILAFRPGSVTLSMCYISNEGGGSKYRFNVKYCRTTEEIKNYIDSDFASYVPENGKKYLNVAFSGREGLRLKKIDFSKPFICKYKNNYLVQINDNGISAECSPEKAIVFNNLDDFLEKTKNCIWCREKLTVYKPIKNKTNEQQKKYAVRCTNLYGMPYVHKMSRNHWFSTSNWEKAMRFPTIKQAEKYLAKVASKNRSYTFFVATQYSDILVN